MTETLGQRVRRLLEQQRRTQQELGTIAKVSKNYVSNLENGTSKIEAIAKALGVSRGYLLDGEGSNAPSPGFSDLDAKGHRPPPGSYGNSAPAWPRTRTASAPPGQLSPLSRTAGLCH